MWQGSTSPSITLPAIALTVGQACVALLDVSLSLEDLQRIVRGSLMTHPIDNSRFGSSLNRYASSSSYRPATDGRGVVGDFFCQSLRKVVIGGVENQETCIPHLESCLGTPFGSFRDENARLFSFRKLLGRTFFLQGLAKCLNCFRGSPYST